MKPPQPADPVFENSEAYAGIVGILVETLLAVWIGGAAGDRGRRVATAPSPGAPRGPRQEGADGVGTRDNGAEPTGRNQFAAPATPDLGSSSARPEFQNS